MLLEICKFGSANRLRICRIEKSPEMHRNPVLAIVRPVHDPTQLRQVIPRLINPDTVQVDGVTPTSGLISATATNSTTLKSLSPKWYNLNKFKGVSCVICVCQDCNKPDTIDRHEKSDFVYTLPDKLIAQKPLPDRQASRLLCVNKQTGKLSDQTFNHFIELLKDNDLLVFNDTKVIPARLFGTKPTGGKVEILIERILNKNQAIAHVKSSKTPKSGSLIKLADGSFCEVIDREDDLFKLKFSDCTPLLDLLSHIGHIPLPPYITRADDESDITRYQSVFAKQPGAIAAPTASLHFDETLLEAISAKGVASSFVTLHVGSGTFQPVRVDDLSLHTMHVEYYSVSAATVAAVQATKAQGGRVIAIGTTAVRALESASASGQLVAASGDTALFIAPGYSFKVVDALLTNFHLPESTLLMLVSAFAGYTNVMNAYRHAIDQSYRFYSYGDAMFLSN